MKALAIIAGVLLAAVVVVGLVLKSVGDALNENLSGPCESCHWPTYRSDRYDFELRYPNGSSVHDGADSSHIVGNYFDGTRTPIVTIVPSGDFPERAFLTVSVATDIKTEARCSLMLPEGGNTPVRMRHTYGNQDQNWFNGNAFVRPATGTHMQHFVFHAFHAGICYEVTLNGLAATHERAVYLIEDKDSAWAHFGFFPSTFSFRHHDDWTGGVPVLILSKASGSAGTHVSVVARNCLRPFGARSTLYWHNHYGSRRIPVERTTPATVRALFVVLRSDHVGRGLLDLFCFPSNATAAFTVTR